MIEPVEGQVYLSHPGRIARQVISVEPARVRIRAYPKGLVAWWIKRSSFTARYREQTPRQRRQSYWEGQR